MTALSWDIAKPDTDRRIYVGGVGPRDHQLQAYSSRSIRVLVNYKKSVLNPSQSMIFLGFAIDSRTIEIRLPAEKVKNTIEEAQNLLKIQPGS